MIRIESLTKTYQTGEDTLHVLKEIDVAIERGEFVSIMGPSGSGKSTLMHIIGCLDTPTSGRYVLNGHEVSTLAPRELAKLRNEEIGFVFQNFHLLPRMTALRNVELPMMYAGVPRQARQERAAELLEQVGLGNRLTHLPTALSGGQKQRVAIARALANHPSILLADEPTGALDQKTGAEIMALFQSLHEAGMTIILITHDANVATYAQRTIHIVDGMIQSEVPRS